MLPDAVAVVHDADGARELMNLGESEPDTSTRLITMT